MLDEEVYENEDPRSVRLEPGDRLFIEDQARQEFDALTQTAYFGSIRRGTFFSYAIAYHEAADRLAQSINDVYSSDQIIIPIVFLYRHSVELMLKDLLIERDKQLGRLKEYGHGIRSLWQKLKPLLQEIYPPPEKSREIEAVEACLMELSEIDESSESFRYPVYRDYNPTLKNNQYLNRLQYIDVQHLADKMASLHGFLSEAGMLLLLKKSIS